MKLGFPYESRGRRGQALVEFAFVFPVFMLLLMGIIEFGWAVYVYNTVSHAATEGARKGIVLTRVPDSFSQAGNNTGTYTCTAPPAGTIVAVVCQRIGPLTPNRVQIALTSPLDSPKPLSTIIPGLTVNVVVSYPYTPLLANFFPIPAGLRFSGSSTRVTQ